MMEDFATAASQMALAELKKVSIMIMFTTALL
jgi:hypothetical protein